MKTGFPPCEGLGPELVATYVAIRVNGCPLVVSAGGKKCFTMAYSQGSLVLASEDFISDALELVDRIASEINSERLAGADWAAVRQTSASFRRWVDDIYDLWQQR